MPSEAVLMRACAPLYGTIAIESLVGIVMGCTFLYLWMQITAKSQLKAPARSFYRLVKFSVTRSCDDFSKEAGKWTQMPSSTLVERFQFCRTCNQAVVLLQALIAFVSITRWLHIGNVNGFRYLGSAFTCPLMQAQLVVMIAPVMPFYRMSLFITLVVTSSMLIFGWTASIRRTPLFSCSFDSLLALEDTCFDFTEKFWNVMPAVLALSFLSFVQIPCLAVVYKCSGGSENPLLPHGYLKMLAIVAITWLGFPIWWSLSFEGMALFEDTKLHSVGFAVLNVISKGALALHVVSMSQHGQSPQTVVAQGRHVNDSLRLMSMCSSDPAEVRAALSLTTWLIHLLRCFDDGAASPPSTASAPGALHLDEEWGDGDTLSTRTPTDEGSLWDGLEPMYARFLHDSGVTPSAFIKLGIFEKVNLRRKFDTIARDMDARPDDAPEWLTVGANLSKATDREVAAEMRRRLEAQQTASHEHPRHVRFDGMPPPGIDISIVSTDLKESGCRRAYQV